MNQYIITKEIIAELIDYSNAEDAEACIRNIIKTKVYPYPYNPQAEREKVLDEVLLRINNLLDGLYDEKKKSFWFRLSQAKSNSIAEFTLRFIAGMVEELRRAGSP